MTKPIGAVNRNTLLNLRTRYEAMWKRPWPHDDDYLKLLWRRARDEVAMDHAGFDKERYDVTLNAMRENHEFDGEETSVKATDSAPPGAPAKGGAA